MFEDSADALRASNRAWLMRLAAAGSQPKPGRTKTSFRSGYSDEGKMYLRMRAAAGGLTLMLLLQPFAVLTCLCMCLGPEHGSCDRPTASEVMPEACHHGASSFYGPHGDEVSEVGPESRRCAHAASDPATLSSRTGDAASRGVAAILPRVLLASSARTSERSAQVLAASESPPGIQLAGPLRI